MNLDLTLAVKKLSYHKVPHTTVIFTRIAQHCFSRCDQVSKMTPTHCRVLKFFLRFCLFLCRWEMWLDVYLCILCMPGAHSGFRRVLDSLELELEMWASMLVLHWAISPALNMLFIHLYPPWPSFWDKIQAGHMLCFRLSFPLSPFKLP